MQIWRAKKEDKTKDEPWHVVSDDVTPENSICCDLFHFMQLHSIFHSSSLSLHCFCNLWKRCINKHQYITVLCNATRVCVNADLLPDVCVCVCVCVRACVYVLGIVSRDKILHFKNISIIINSSTSRTVHVCTSTALSEYIQARRQQKSKKQTTATTNLTIIIRFYFQMPWPLMILCQN